LTPLELKQKLLTLTPAHIDLLAVSLPDAYYEDLPFVGGSVGVTPLIQWAQEDGRKWQTVVDTLQALFPHLFQPTSPAPDQRALPYGRNAYFIEREEDLERLDRFFTANRDTALILAITGPSGIGKTQTALEYAYRHWDDYRAIFWCSADSAAGLNAAYRNIAARLGLPEKDAQALEETNEAIRTWLAANTDYLLILDDVEDPAFVSAYLPPDPAGHILVTTDAHDYADLPLHGRFHLGRLPDYAALELLLKRSHQESATREERSYAAVLCRELDGIPLALELAAAYIAHTQTSFSAYLAEYLNLQAELREPQGLVPYQHSDAVRIACTLSMAAVRARSEAAAEALMLRACFAPDALPRTLLDLNTAEEETEAAQAHSDPLEDRKPIEEPIALLHALALLHGPSEEDAGTLHRAVQAVIRAGMDSATRRSYTERAVRALNRAFPAASLPFWLFPEPLLVHALPLAMEIAERNLESLEAASLLNRIGIYLHKRCQYTVAEPLFTWALTLTEKLSGADPLIAILLNNLACLYESQGLLQQAEAHYLRAIDRYTQAIPSEPLGSGPPRSQPGALCGKHEGYAPAALLSPPSMLPGEKEAWAEPPDIVGILTNLAQLYISQGRSDQAEALYRSALTITEQTLGSANPHTALYGLNLVALYAIQSLYPRAESLALQALAIMEATLGREHPLAAHCLLRLAYLYAMQRKNKEELERLLQRARKILTILTKPMDFSS